MRLPPKPLADRFEEFVSPEPMSGCWLWTGAWNGRYGVIREAGRGSLLVRAHRVAWMIFVGDIPEDMHVLHKCDVTLCVNPDHLFIGDHAANMADMVAKGRGRGRNRKGPVALGAFPALD